MKKFSKNRSILNLSNDIYRIHIEENAVDFFSFSHLGVGEDKSEYSYHGMLMFSVFFLTESLIESEKRIQSSNQCYIAWLFIKDDYLYITQNLLVARNIENSE